VINGVLINGAKKSREGLVAKSGVFSEGHADLVYDGPRTADELWEDESFRKVSLVRVQSNKVERTRPIFEEWSAEIVVNYEDTLVNVTRVEEWLAAAGTQVGIGDWRPQHGRFTVERLS
jgi:hypothetical protein